MVTSPKTDVSAVGVGALAVGALLLWSGIKGASVLSTLQSLIQGKRPTGENVNPIQAAGQAASNTGAAIAGGAATNTPVLAMARQVAASPAGRRNYCWGGGHTNSPCSAKCFDCSGYVSCVLNKLGLLKGSMVTTGFMVWSGATTVPYAERQPGDLYVSRGHIGIIADDKQMWNAACTRCGPVKLSDYTGRRGYIVRRVRGAR